MNLKLIIRKVDLAAIATGRGQTVRQLKRSIWTARRRFGNNMPSRREWQMVYLLFGIPRKPNAADIQAIQFHFGYTSLGSVRSAISICRRRCRNRERIYNYTRSTW